MKMKGLSLRYKLLAALTVIPLIGLSLFLLLAVNIFEKDKIAYIFDSSLSVSKTRAARVSTEITSVISLTQAVVLSYRADTKDLAEAGNYYFERETKFEAFRIYAIDSSSGTYVKTVDLVKDKGRSVMKEQEGLAGELLKLTETSSIIVRRPTSVKEKLFLAVRFGAPTDPKRVVAVALLDALELSRVFQDKGAYRSFLLLKDGAAVFESESEKGWGAVEIWRELAKKKVPEGIAELSSPTKVNYLASFVEVGAANLAVVSMVDKGAALQAVDVLIRKSILFFISVICATAILAVLASRSLTSALSRLSLATRKVAEGDFAVRVSVKSGGEIGLLATSFNVMAEEVSRLMKETAEKARMETELATAKTVQETLFPSNHATLGPVQISGHYQPASECGGDWWYYFENGDKVYIWIGDATGHGAPAALLTSAARAVASVINFGPPVPPGQALTVLNRAICETSKGRMMMTFFLACIDKQTGEMTYVNASHEPPLLVHPSEEPPDRDAFIPLNDVNNPRLGENQGHEFKQASIQLQAGDRLIFYTDGVVDVKSPEHKNWGERRFLKSLAAEMSQTTETAPALEGVVHQLHSFRSETPLDDDVTLVLCTFKGAA